MTRLTRWIATALLIGAITACAPNGDELARWQGHCLNAADTIALADRSRNGIAPGCDATGLERRAAR